MFNKKKFLDSDYGQALVSLLFFMVIAIMVTSAAIIILTNNSLTTSKNEQGTIAFYFAESGIENALLRLMRDPDYSGETLPIGEGNAVVQVTQGNPIVILSTGINGNSIRKIQAQAAYSNYLLNVISWKEVY